MSIPLQPILVVGAGLSGCVYARTLAEAGLSVLVIDKRPHVAGNAYDEIGADGILRHRYGPHLFHTANQRVLQWIRRFAEWSPYTHRVRAVLPDRRTAPLPINLDTINIVFGTDFTNNDDGQQHLTRVAVPHATIRNAADYLESRVGTLLTNLFFRPYTKKMWSLDLEDLDVSVIKRIPIRSDRVDTYFPVSDTQVLPKGGYTKFVGKILDHPLISVRTGRPFQHEMLKSAFHSFLSMPIDEFYGFSEGYLPYRSIRFHDRTVNVDQQDDVWAAVSPSVSVLNFTDTTPFTRETAWHNLPHHLVHDTGKRSFTREEPCDYVDNDFERYYPVKTADNRNEDLYKVYQKRAAASAHVTFIGRCGTYQYLDMDQVINQSLMGAEAWLKRHAMSAPPPRTSARA